MSLSRASALGYSGRGRSRRRPHLAHGSSSSRKRQCPRRPEPPKRARTRSTRTSRIRRGSPRERSQTKATAAGRGRDATRREAIKIPFPSRAACPWRGGGIPPAAACSRTESSVIVTVVRGDPRSVCPLALGADPRSVCPLARHRGAIDPGSTSAEHRRKARKVGDAMEVRTQEEQVTAIICMVQRIRIVLLVLGLPEEEFNIPSVCSSLRKKSTDMPIGSVGVGAKVCRASSEDASKDDACIYTVSAMAHWPLLVAFDASWFSHHHCTLPLNNGVVVRS